jgi:hypothetical protein
MHRLGRAGNRRGVARCRARGVVSLSALGPSFRKAAADAHPQALALLNRMQEMERELAEARRVAAARFSARARRSAAPARGPADTVRSPARRRLAARAAGGVEAPAHWKLQAQARPSRATRHSAPRAT